ncbi:uncharacterized protein LOC108913064 [Anoplophora glabripennis]|uniref:uncharacterized protein LOC108913064 n=1 Tax=Anoplophora glabripennis TaxID=217634 RepID=UPI000874E1A5|nr:uncharacterized protein LOC108913064 [Anoplophora glabripennis]
MKTSIHIDDIRPAPLGNLDEDAQSEYSTSSSTGPLGSGSSRSRQSEAKDHTGLKSASLDGLPADSDASRSQSLISYQDAIASVVPLRNSGAGEEGTMSRSPTPIESERSSGSEAGDSRPSTPGSVVETTSRESELAAENARLRQMIDDLRDELRQQRKAFDDLEKRSREQHAELLNALKGQQTPKGVKRGKPGTSSGSEEEPCKAKKKPSKENEAPVAEQAKVPATTSERAAPAEKAERIPPVILRKKEQWTEVSRSLTNRKINYTRARLTGEGIAIHPQTPDDYRCLTRVLADEGKEFHTFSLPSERLLRAVIRGLPDGISNEEIRSDLEVQGFKITSVFIMKSRRNKAPIPLVLVQVPQEQEDLLKVTRCYHLVVRVESQRARTEPTQCHRCQCFGHAQSRCTAAVKCVKCGEGHHSADCTKKREIPAKCANCGGEHPASYRGWPSFPKKTTGSKKQQRKEDSQADKTQAKLAHPRR